MEKKERYIEKMKEEHNEEVLALRDKIKRMAARGAEQIRRLKEDVSRLLNDLRFEKRENRKLVDEAREKSGYCKYLEKCLLKEEKGREERLLMEKVKEMKTMFRVEDSRSTMITVVITTRLLYIQTILSALTVFFL